jgi:hypothetical protein
VTPEGYRIAQVVPCPEEPGRPPESLVGLADENEADPSRPITLLLVATGPGTLVEDRVVLAGDGSSAGDLAPNYVQRIVVEELEGGRVFLVWTAWSGGGSGAVHYFDLYRSTGGTLQRVERFTHDRPERGYFTVYRGSVYDASVQCERGPKQGNAYRYSCQMKVTKFQLVGTELQPVASESCRQRQGNRFLNEKYWGASVREALQRGEVFR